MKNKKNISSILFCIAGALIVSCATTKDSYKEVDSAVVNHNYAQAIRAIETDSASDKPRIYPKNSEVLLHLDKGILEHYEQQFEASFTDLETAEEKIDQFRAASITESAATFISNDNVATYQGEDYEDVYDSVFNALNNYHLGRTEQARVEARQINEKLSQLIAQAEAQGKQVQSYASGQFKGFSMPEEIVKSAGPVQFNNSALGNYLSMVLLRERSEAQAAGKQITEAYLASPNIYGEAGKLPAELQNGADAELKVPAGKGRLNVLAFTGLSPLKMEEKLMIPLAPLNYILVAVNAASAAAGKPIPPEVSTSLLTSFATMSFNIAYPRMADTPRNADINRVKVEIQGQEPFELFMLEDMGRVATETFKTKQNLILTKAFIRSLGKTVTAVVGLAAAEIAASQAKDIKEQLAAKSLLTAAKPLVNAALASTEAADTRMARYLPNQAYVGGINLDPGDYGVKITYYNNNGQQIGAPFTKTVTVKEGQPNIIEAVNLQ
jgi:hypothetical protein